jgi:hypothetical protein
MRGLKEEMILLCWKVEEQIEMEEVEENVLVTSPLVGVENWRKVVLVPWPEEVEKVKQLEGEVRMILEVKERFEEQENLLMVVVVMNSKGVVKSQLEEGQIVGVMVVGMQEVMVVGMQEVMVVEMLKVVGKLVVKVVVMLEVVLMLVGVKLVGMGEEQQWLVVEETEEVGLKGLKVVGSYSEIL